MTMEDFETRDSSNSSLDYNSTFWFFHDCTIHLDTENRRIALFLMSLLIFMLGLLENLLVLWVNWQQRHMGSGVLFCIINISLSDLMMVLTSPFFMLEFAMDKVWIWGRFLCRVTHLIYMLNFYSSSLFLALMTLERYFAIVCSSALVLFPRGSRQRWLLCVGVWLLSLALALMENSHVSLLEWDEPGCYLLPDYNYMDWSVALTLIALVFQFMGPSTVIVTCNMLMARAIHSSPNMQGKQDVWLVHFYSFVFVVTWLPYHLVCVMVMVYDLAPQIFSCNVIDLIYFSYDIVQVVSLLHCVANPILYNFLSKSFSSNLFSSIVPYLPPPSELQVNNVDDVIATGTKERNQCKVSKTNSSQIDSGSEDMKES